MKISALRLPAKRSDCASPAVWRRVSIYAFCAWFAAFPAVQAAAQGIAADPKAAASQRAGVANSLNGTQVLNIVAPNATGLSHNLFQDFNVEERGLVVNNSKVGVSSDLAGSVVANPNLGGGEASIILNEVTSANRSLLAGPQELVGRSAEYILANPNGITCDGCGFIDFNRVTLSTGVPLIGADGRFAGLDVNRGDVTVGASGLNASGIDYFDVISRSIALRGEVHARNLRMIAGRNSFDVASDTATAKAADGSTEPLFAIDSAALGGMYAQRIAIIATESGVGVRLRGDVAASVGDVELDASGNIRIAGSGVPGHGVSAKGNIDIAAVGAGALTLVNADLEAVGLALRGGAFTLDGAQLSATSIALDGSNFSIGDTQVFAGNSLALRGDSLDLTGSTSRLQSGADLDLDLGGALTTAGGTVLRSGDAMSLAAGDTILRGAVSATSTLDITAAVLAQGVQSEIRSDGALSIDASSMILNGKLGTSSGATLDSQGDLRIGGTLLSTGNLVLGADGVVTIGGAVASATGTVGIDATGGVDLAGSLGSAGALVLDSGGAVAIAGELKSGAALDLQAEAFSIGATGVVAASGPIDAAVDSATIDGNLGSKGALSLHASNGVGVGDAGQVVAEQGLALLSDAGAITVAGSARAGTALVLTAAAGTVEVGGDVAAGGALDVEALVLRVLGSAKAGGALGVDVRSAGIGSAGVLAAKGALDLHAEKNIGLVAGGSIAGEKGVQLLSDSGAINLNGTLSALEALGVEASAGDLAIGGDVATAGALTLKSSALGVSGTVAATGAVTADADTATIDGSLGSKDALSLHASNGVAVGDAGTVVAEQGLAVLADAGAITVAGSALAGTDLALTATAGAVEVAAGGDVAAGGALDVEALVLRLFGSAKAGGALGVDVRAAGIGSAGVLAAKGALDVHTVNNIGLAAGGSIAGEKGVQLLSDSGAINLNGTLSALGALGVEASAGNLAIGGDVDTGGALTLKSNALGVSGSVVAAGVLSAQADSATIEGSLGSKGALTLQATNDVSILAGGQIDGEKSVGLVSDAGAITVAGSARAGTALVLTAAAGTVEVGGDVAAGGALDVEALVLRVLGSAKAGGALGVDVRSAGIGSAGVLAAKGALDLHAEKNIGLVAGGSIAGEKGVQLLSDSGAINLNGTLSALEALGVEASAGDLAIGGDVATAGALTLKSSALGVSGTVAATGAVTADADTATIDGSLGSKDALSLHASNGVAVGDAGTVVAEQGLAVLVAFL